MARAARSLRVIRSTGPAEGKSISEDSSEKLCRVPLQLVDLGDERAAADAGRLKSSEQVATRGERRTRFGCRPASGSQKRTTLHKYHESDPGRLTNRAPQRGTCPRHHRVPPIREVTRTPVRDAS